MPPYSGQQIRAHLTQGKVLVIGANGYIGRHLVPALIKAGYKVKASSRDRANLDRYQWHGAEKVQCDILDTYSVNNVLSDVEIIYYLAHSMSDAQDYLKIERRGAENVRLAAQAAGVKHIIYLGSLTSPNTYSTHLRSRELTGNALRQGSAIVTELRAPIVIGPGSAPFEVFRDIVNHLPLMILPKQMLFTSSPIALRDILHYLVELPDCKALHGQIVDCCGPEKISYLDIIKRYARFKNKHFSTFLLPALPIKLVRFAISAFTTAPAGIIRALLGGFNHDINAEPALIQQHIPRKLVSLEQAFSDIVVSENNQKESLSWFHGNMIFRLHDTNNAYYGEQINVSRDCEHSAKALWQQLSRLGGDNGYFYLDILWRIRGFIDKVFGGPGMIRHRDNSRELYSGDRIDTWIIKEAAKHKRLLMQFEMRGPGAGCLEFKLTPNTQGCRLSINAFWHPKGFLGRAYWVLFKPAHLLIFNGMIKAIIKRAGQKS